MASAYLHRTNGTATNSQKMTFSTWFKIGTGSAQKSLFGSLTGSGPYTQVKIMALATHNNVFRFEAASIEGNAIDLKFDRSLRDPAAWYHLVVAIDTTQVSASDRAKIYISGVQQTSFATATYPTLNDTLDFSATGIVAQVGAYNNTEHWDGAFAHTYFTDGYTYAASDFGETDSTSGIWIAKASVSVTYGNNGFFLKYASGAITTDSSGNGNTMTQVGTITNLKDNPDNNFATFNPLDNYFPASTFTNGNTTQTTHTTYYTYNTSTMCVDSGKWYVEMKNVTTNSQTIGIAGSVSTATSDEMQNKEYNWGYIVGGQVYSNSSLIDTYGSYTTGDIIGIGLDLTNNKLYFSLNGVWQGSSNPSTGTGGISITAPSSNTTGWYSFAAGDTAGAAAVTSANFGNGYFGTTAVASTNADDAGIGSFEYDVPTGFYALCTNNLGDQS